jgi:hypothetical protein
MKSNEKSAIAIMAKVIMSESEFKEFVEDIIIQIEDALEELDSDIDY